MFKWIRRWRLPELSNEMGHEVLDEWIDEVVAKYTKDLVNIFHKYIKDITKVHKNLGPKDDPIGEDNLDAEVDGLWLRTFLCSLTIVFDEESHKHIFEDLKEFTSIFIQGVEEIERLK
jgi:hypothetical protein